MYADRNIFSLVEGAYYGLSEQWCTAKIVRSLSILGRVEVLGVRFGMVLGKRL